MLQDRITYGWKHTEMDYNTDVIYSMCAHIHMSVCVCECVCFRGKRKVYPEEMDFCYSERSTLSSPPRFDLR